MPASPERILENLFPFYRQEEFPVLLHQYKTWSESRPLEGCRIIDASSLVHEREKKSCRIIGSRDSIWGLRMEFVQEYASIYEANRCKR